MPRRLPRVLKRVALISKCRRRREAQRVQLALFQFERWRGVFAMRCCNSMGHGRHADMGFMG